MWDVWFQPSSTDCRPADNCRPTLQALLNLAMLPELVEVMQRYGKKVPNYIHGSNLPPTHLRPITAPPALGAHIASLGLGLTSPPLTKRAIATAPAGQAGMQGLG